MKPRMRFSTLLFSFILLGIFIAGMAYFGSRSYTTDKPGVIFDPTQEPTMGPGYCSGHVQCRDFGTRNCGGYQFGLCGEDSLCHCCIPLRGERCISCQEINCPSSDRYCLGGSTGACVFKLGGKTTQ